MKAVNLIPAEQRRDAGGRAGRSGGAAYVLLGALAVLVVLAGVWAVTGKAIKDREADLARVEREASAAEARATALAPYTQFNQLRVKRTQTIRSIAASRFDWAHSLHEVARVVPSDVEVESLRGTVTPSVPVGGAATANPLRAALPDPAVELVGCAPSQAQVARMIVRMRLIDGVKRVSLQESKKLEDVNSTATAGVSGDDCRHGDPEVARFNLVAFFDPVRPKGTPSAAAASAPQPAAATATPGVTP